LSTVVPFLDVVDPGFRVDSDEVDRAREANWYARTPLGIAILRYHEAVALLKDPRLHQGSAVLLTLRGVHDGPIHDWWEHVILNANGEQHARLRRLVGRAFTPPAADALRPSMRATAERLVDQFAEAGACEFMEAFANPYPLAIISELLAIPEEQRAAFSRWATDLSFVFSPNVAALRDRIEEALAGLYACVDRLIEDRRRAPREDLASKLVLAEEDGERLTTEELRSMLVTLVLAGNDTTRNQLGLSLALMAKRPDLWTKVAKEPGLTGTAVDEILRIAPTIPNAPRLVGEDLDFGDLHLPQGTYVQLLLGSANRDRTVFGDRDVDIERELPAPSLAFGSGMHRCLGMWLARAELSEALPILARRMPNLALTGEPTWKPALGIFGPLTLPLTFSTVY
jgi:cytochrome P450